MVYLKFKRRRLKQ